MQSFLIMIKFDADRILSALAAQLSKEMGVELIEETSGRFDEVPAYVWQRGDLQIFLFGPPEGVTTNQIQLKVRMRTYLPLTDVHAFIPTFFAPIFVNKDPNAGGFVDCSDEMVRALRLRGFLDCSKMDQDT